MLMKKHFDLVIIGGGAAGLFCAAEAGKRGRSVVVLERAARIGKKILISGGGRCNFTNIHCRPENFISANPHFCKSALARYSPSDFIALVEKHGIRYHEKAHGQLFCDGSSLEVLSMLEQECRAAKVSILTGANIIEVSRPDGFCIHTSDIEFRAPALVVATGGLSIPKMGATGFGYDLARQFGLKIRECKPGLVPLTFRPEDSERYSDLAGVSAEVVVSDGKRNTFQEKMLFTHRGLSGPSILQISSYWNGSDPISIDLVPDCTPFTLLLQPKSRRDLNAARSELRKALPNRLADRWLDAIGPATWSNHEIAELEQRLHHWAVTPAGTEGFDKAEVTVGGVDTDELSAKSMEARRIPGLFFIGEVVDVTGHLGGFNFQWAWSSAYVAAQAL